MTELEVSIRERSQLEDFFRKAKFSYECADFSERMFMVDPY